MKKAQGSKNVERHRKAHQESHHHVTGAAPVLQESETLLHLCCLHEETFKAVLQTSSCCQSGIASDQHLLPLKSFPESFDLQICKVSSTTPTICRNNGLLQSKLVRNKV